MSQKYRFRSLQLLEEETKKDEQLTKLTVFEKGEAKIIDFVLLNGTRQNFAYSHYITSWIGKEDGKRVIKIFFATHLVTINGYCLDMIYDELIKLSVKSIKAHNERYSSIVEEDKAFVTDINITWKKETNTSIES